jgi:Ca2+:H+ antiporter
MASLALLTAVPFVISAVFNVLPKHPDDAREMKALREISLTTSVILLIIFLLWAIFRYKSHSYLYDEENFEYAPPTAAAETPRPTLRIILGYSILLILALAGSIACSSFLVISLRDAPDHKPVIASDFIMAIVIPIATSFSNFEKTMSVAYRGDIDLAVILTLGTSVKISLLALPVLILVGDALRRPFLLDFKFFDSNILLIASFVTSLLVGNGKSNWLKGATAVGL